MCGLGTERDGKALGETDTGQRQVLALSDCILNPCTSKDRAGAAAEAGHWSA